MFDYHPITEIIERGIVLDANDTESIKAYAYAYQMSFIAVKKIAEDIVKERARL